MKQNPNHTESAGAGHNRSRIELVPVAVLKVREGDPRRYSPRDIELAQAALRQLPVGVPLPVVVNAEGEILVGGLFVAAARKLEIKNLAVIHHEGLSEIEEKQYSVAINQLLSKGEWDPVALEAWVREFEAGLEDFSHLALGFDNGELDNILGMAGALAGGGGDEAPPLKTNAVSRVGMTWLETRGAISLAIRALVASTLRRSSGLPSFAVTSFARWSIRRERANTSPS
jgi:hypothetical protein